MARSGTQSSDAGSIDDAAAADGKGFREPLGDNAVEHLRRYQSMTIPPSARRALMRAELPPAAPELLHDTLPPRLGVQRSNQEPTVELDAAPAPSPTRRRKLRGFVLGVAAVMLALLLSAWLVGPGQPQQPTAVSQPPPKAGGVTVEPRAAPAAQSPAVALRSTVEEPTSATATRPEPTERAERAERAERRTERTRHSKAARGSPAPAAPSTLPSPAPTAPPAKKFRLGSR